jgi:uncharacterized protein (UPF0332 family)
MDINVKKYLDRAESELILANANFSLSISNEIKNIFKIQEGMTFFSNVISESYYAIFYTAKAYLLFLGIKTSAPEEHKKTYDEFKKLVESGKIDKELLKIYDEETYKAETLLQIFFFEKRNRGRFTYNISSEANKPFAEASLKNSKTFCTAIKNLIETQ